MYVSVGTLRNVVRSLFLVEGKVEDLQAQFPNIDVAKLATGDPSPTKKYLQWMVKQASLGAKPEDIVPTISIFHAKSSKFKHKDINAYKTLKELEDEAKMLSTHVSSTQSKVAMKAGAKKIFEDENVVVIRPDTKDSCVYYGANTRWCITMRGADYYDEYVRSGVVFYFFIDKKAQAHSAYGKIAMAVPRDRDMKLIERHIEFFTAVDDPITRDEAEEAFGADLVELALNDAKKAPMHFLLKFDKGAATPSDIFGHWSSLDKLGKYKFLIAPAVGQPIDIAKGLLEFAKDKNEREVLTDIVSGAAVAYRGTAIVWRGDGAAATKDAKKAKKKHRAPTDDYDFLLPYRPDDKPAVIEYEGTMRWYSSPGVLGRAGDKPAVIFPGTIYWWYDNSRLSRGNDRPARIRVNPNGKLEYEWLVDGLRHRDGDKPALVTPFEVGWAKDGAEHRDGDEPAFITRFGTIEWAKDGVMTGRINDIGERFSRIETYGVVPISFEAARKYYNDAFHSKKYTEGLETLADLEKYDDVSGI